MEALAAQSERLSEIEIYTMFPVGSCLYADPGVEGRFKVKTFSVGNLRRAVERKQAEYIPVHFSQIGRLILEKKIPVDVLMIQLSRPDKNGNFSCGISVEYMKEAIEAAGIVIAEINDQMPRTCGDTLVPSAKVDYIVEVSRPLLTYDPGLITETEEKIGELVSDLIPDCSVLQFGPGKIYRAILKHLNNKKDIGVHTGLFTDDIIPLVKKGVITGTKKTIDRHKIIATAIIGTEKVYDFIHNNKLVELKPANYTHNIRVLSRIDNFISLNSAIEVDLTGQVNSETIGLSLINGVGGMIDFVRGAIASNGGRAILALPSITRDGKKSRVVPLIKEGIVTAGRADFHYIVTEYGITDLYGSTVSERAQQMISIAHPRFRNELRDKAVAMALL